MLTAQQIAAIFERVRNEPVSDVEPMACHPDFYRAAQAAMRAELRVKVAHRWYVAKLALDFTEFKKSK